MELPQLLQLQLQESGQGQRLRREGGYRCGSSSNSDSGAADDACPRHGMGIRVSSVRTRRRSAEPLGQMQLAMSHTHTHTHTHTHHPRASCRPRYHTHTLLFLQCYCLATNHIPQHDSRPCGLHGTQIRDVQMILRMQDQSCLWNVVWRVDDVEGPPIRSAPLGVWRRLQV